MSISKKDSSSKKSSESKTEDDESEEQISISETIIKEILNSIFDSIESIRSGSVSEKSRLSKYFIPVDKKDKKYLSVIMAFAARQRPRQPFFQQMQQNAQRPSAPTTTQQNQISPSYSPSQPYPPHPMGQPFGPTQPMQPVRTPAPPSYYPGSSTFNRVTDQQPRREVAMSHLPLQQPGQMVTMPNNYFNLSYWAPYPANIPPGVPAYLAHLVNSDSLFIVQQLDLIELYLNIEEPNFYLIQNTNGQCIYYAYETTNLCGQACCKTTRPLQLHIMDMYHNEVIYLNKPCGSTDCCCCYPFIEVYSPPLEPVGAVLRTNNCTKTEFIIVDADENRMFKIRGPLCLSVCNCVLEADFTIHALDAEKTEIGVIRREFGGFIRNVYTNADYYGISFPVDLDVRIKAVFLGALFLIDYTYFEH